MVRESSKHSLLRALVRATLPTLVVFSGAAQADPYVLWRIVHEHCVPQQLHTHTPDPCIAVEHLSHGIGNGYAILKTPCGVTQFLLIPTARISGIESSELLGAPNYWVFAWEARSRVREIANSKLSDDQIGLAINSADGRDQSQLHIHIDRVRPEVTAALRQLPRGVPAGWSKIKLMGHDYWALRVRSLKENPFKLVAARVRASGGEMRLQTVVVIGTPMDHGRSGFYILNDEASDATGDHASGEELQVDHMDCRGRASGQ
jgi:CDP-diacylglycerol pyrophosphatase